MLLLLLVVLTACPIEAFQGHLNLSHEDEVLPFEGWLFWALSEFQEWRRLHSHIPETQPDTKLKFIHIPKNAGKTIEEMGKYSRIDWGQREKRPGCKKQNCSVWHTPPPWRTDECAWDSNVETFCVTRHPFERAVSEFGWLLQMDDLIAEQCPGATCDAESMNACLQRLLKKRRDGDPYLNDCHLLQQHYYIWDKSGRKYCHNILRFDELPGSFNKLMEEKSLSVRLRTLHEHHTHCGLTTEDLHEDTRDELRAAYSDDFRLLNYSESRDTPKGHEKMSFFLEMGSPSLSDGAVRMEAPF